MIWVSSMNAMSCSKFNWAMGCSKFKAIQQVVGCFCAREETHKNSSGQPGWLILAGIPQMFEGMFEI